MYLLANLRCVAYPKLLLHSFWPRTFYCLNRACTPNRVHTIAFAFRLAKNVNNIHAAQYRTGRIVTVQFLRAGNPLPLAAQVNRGRAVEAVGRPAPKRLRFVAVNHTNFVDFWFAIT